MSTTTKAQHGPALRYPFRVFPDRLRGGYYIADAEGTTVCGDFDTEAVAALLVHNLNSHAALVAALEAVKARADSIYAMGHEEARRAAVDCYEIASAALKQARGE
jgi:hypothetical protein